MKLINLLYHIIAQVWAKINGSLNLPQYWRCDGTLHTLSKDKVQIDWYNDWFLYSVCNPIWLKYAMHVLHCYCLVCKVPFICFMYISLKNVNFNTFMFCLCFVISIWDFYFLLSTLAASMNTYLRMYSCISDKLSPGAHIQNACAHSQSLSGISCMSTCN